MFAKTCYNSTAVECFVRFFFIQQSIVGELQCEHNSAGIRNAYMSINCSCAAAYCKLKHNRINRKIDKTKTKVPFNL